MVDMTSMSPRGQVWPEGITIERHRQLGAESGKSRLCLRVEKRGVGGFRPMCRHAY